MVMIPPFLSITKYRNLVGSKGLPDLGVITKVQKVSDVDLGLDEAGRESDEFESVSTRYSYTVEVDLLSSHGLVSNAIYMMSGLSGAGGSGMVPMVGEGVLVLYVGMRRNPIALGGFNLWQVMRRLIADELFPELKPGEVFHQAAIREDPMSFFDSTEEQPDGELAYTEVLKGARVYLDYKGRLVLESRHFRGDDGAFVQIILGNPASTVVADEENDFNDIDPTAESLIALQGLVAPTPDVDPVFKFAVTQDGKVSFEFVKAWFGKAPGETTEPATTVEVDVAEGLVTFDAETIKAGRDAEQPAVLGDTLKDLMEQLIDLIINMRQPVAGAGPTAGPPTNILQFTQLKSSLETILSGTNLVE